MNRLHAPSGDGELLAVPALASAAGMVARNAACFVDGPQIAGRPFADVRDLARREVSAFAPQMKGNTFFVAGHQPELFHPGVWVKNFALAGLARAHNGIAVNLIIDNDNLKTPALALPLPSDPPRLQWLPFDSADREQPWEERRIHDRATFANFGDEVMARLRPWGYRPMIGELWPTVRELAEGGTLGEAFTEVRRCLERQWGCENLEVPISAVSQTEAFACFAVHLLANLPRFHAEYNRVVRSYRQRQGIRSKNHPVPDLAADGDWLEAPLWGWRATDPRRGRLFARTRGTRVWLRVGHEDWPSVALDPIAWRELAERGYKVRPRALTTTMFARLFLADVFIHGIGGAVYDELTDELIRELFSLTPPEFLVVSATIRLPLQATTDTIEDHRRLVRCIRDLQWNPQRYLGQQQREQLAPVLCEREKWLTADQQTHSTRRERFARLRAISEELRVVLRETEADQRRNLAALDRRLAGNAILRRRDYSFCLYPEGVLRPLCQRLL